MTQGLDDPQNWERFLSVIRKYGNGGMMFEFNTPNLTMEYPATGLVVEWIRPTWTGNRQTVRLDPEEIDGPEGLPITGDGLIVRLPDEAQGDDFEVLFDER